MAFDFPSSPTKGQTVTAPNSVSYVWDTVKWAPTTGVATPAYAPVNSPTFTGDPQVPTAGAGDADTSIASTAFVTTSVNTAANLRVLRAGDTMSGGLHFGSAVAGSQTDVSRHIDLYGGSYGLSVTGGTLNHVGGTTHAFLNNGTQNAIINNSGISVAGNGINYSTVGTHYLAFNWDGTWIRPYVDNTLVGAALATYNWVNGGFLPLGGGTLNNGGNDPLMIYGNPYGRIRYYSPGLRDWRAGVDNQGQFAISDESAGRYCLYITTGNYVYVTGNFVSQGNVYGHNDGNFGIVCDGTNKYFMFSANSWLGGAIANEDLVFSRYNQMSMAARTDAILCDYVSYVAGTGAYANWSDAALKTDIEDAPGGLEQIKKLRPRKFMRKRRPGFPGKDEPEVGFVAQEVREAIPDAVREIEVPKNAMPMEGPVLAVQLDPIVAALVGAVKELSARLEAIETKVNQ